MELSPLGAGSVLNCVSEVSTKISWIMLCKNSARYIKSTISTGLKNIVTPVIKKLAQDTLTGFSLINFSKF